MDLVEFIQSYYMPLIVLACLCIGYIIKRLDYIPDKFIPLIMGCLGPIFAFISNGFSFQVFVGGLFSGLASTGFHQLFKQLIEKGDDASDSK